MPAAPQVIISGKPYELTFRTEEGLPLICLLFMCKILNGHLAAALTRYGVAVVEYIYMANHVHMLVLVRDPEHLPRFVAYLKRESAHAINNLLGRNQRTVWKDGYDPVVILDAEKFFERLVYFYTNPARAGLVTSIDEYPGLSSWVNGFQDKYVLTEDHVPREVIPMLPSPTLTEAEDLRLTHELAEKSHRRYSVEIDTLAWMDCFEETRNGDRAAMAQRIRDAVYAEERRIAAARTRPVLGVAALKRQPITKAHTPKKRGMRMLCMGSDIERRKEVISWFKALFAEREAFKKRLAPREFINYVFPGFFRPGNYLQANLNPALVPF